MDFDLESGVDDAVPRFAGVARVLSGFEGSADDLRQLFVLLEGCRSVERTLARMVEAYRATNWVKCSPDGLIGGQGFLLRQKEFWEFLSSVASSVDAAKHSLLDECHNNPFWRAVKDEIVAARAGAAGAGGGCDGESLLGVDADAALTRVAREAAQFGVRELSFSELREVAAARGLALPVERFAASAARLVARGVLRVGSASDLLSVVF